MAPLSSSTPLPSLAVTTSPVSPFKRWVLWLTLTAFVAQPLAAAAQVVAAGSTPGTRVGAAQNGVPVVQIATPNGAGVSHNQYQQFNVDQRGVVLNNSRTLTQTQQAGWIEGNANLNNGMARIILNEVTSNLPSSLKGYTEVAGQKAEVVIANPNGITCDGCGFINTSRGVLTTGTPVFGGSGSLDAFRVTGGNIAVQGNGLNGSNLDQLDLIARSVQVNAYLWAQNLNVITGPNRVDYASLGVQLIPGQTGQPTVGIDVAALGGMYANKIRLVGTEAGVGVNVAGTLAAQAGDFSLTNAGKVTLSGTVIGNGQATVSAGDDLVHSGTLYGQQGVSLSSGGTLQNTGLVASQADVAVTAQSVDASGVFAAGMDPQGAVTGKGGLQVTAVDTLRAVGRNLAGGSLSFQGGALNLAGAQTQAGGDITWIASQGDIDHRQATTQGQGKLSLSAVAGQVKNDGGVLYAATDLTGNSLGLSNQGGQVVALNDLHWEAGSGSVTNQGGVIQANRNVTLSAGSVDNANTQGNGQGIQAGNKLSVTADQISNRQGNLQAGLETDLFSHGTLDNSQGKLSAGTTLSILDGQGVPSLTINNDNGTVVVGKSGSAGAALNVQAATLAGNGQILSWGDGSLNLSGDYLQIGKVQANGNLSLTVGGLLTNSGTIQAGQGLAVKAATLDNQGTGEISGNQVHVTATDTHTLTNRGLIDGGEVALDAVTLNNLGTGRIYGDHLSIGATTLTNSAENGSAPVIAARNRLDLGVTTLNNLDKAQILSGDDISVGLSLDENRHATGSAQLLTNSSATISAGGDLFVNANQVINKRTEFETAQVVSKAGAEYAVLKWGTPGPDATLLAAWVTTTDTVIAKDSGIGLISADRNVSFNGAVANRMSSILSGGNIILDNASYSSVSQQGQNIKNSVGVTYFCTSCARGGELNYLGYFVLGDPAEITNDGQVQSNIRRTASFLESYVTPDILREWSVNGVHPDDLTSGGLFFRGGVSPYSSSNKVVGNYTVAPAIISANQSITGTASKIDNLNIGGSLEQLGSGSQAAVVSQAKSLDSGAVSLPNSSLYTVKPSSSAQYLVETDPRFVNYGTWISSDYMLKALALDPQKVEKRLGDGYYEQTLIRDQVTQLTGKQRLDGYSNDTAQYQALMDQGVAYAKAHNIAPGIALSADQVAKLSSDIVWLVSKTVVLSDGSRQEVLVPQLYAKVENGGLSNTGALISANSIDLQVLGDVNNSGTLAAKSTKLAANNINNVEGEIRGGEVTLLAKNDFKNVGGEIHAQDLLDLEAGRNVEFSSTLSKSQGQSATYFHSSTSVDKVAGAYVSDGSGKLNIVSGGDAGFIAANLSSAGSLNILSRGNLNISSVGVQETFKADRDADNYVHKYSTSEVGSSISAQGALLLSSQNDIAVRASSVTGNDKISVIAGRNINLVAGESTTTLEVASKDKSSGIFSSKTTVDRQFSRDTAALATTISGDSVFSTAGNNITATGSNVVGTKNVEVVAGNDLTVAAAQTTHQESHFHSEKESGLMMSGASVTLGTRKLTTDGLGTATTAVGSSIGSVTGNVTLAANGKANIVASQVLAPQGDVTVDAQQVAIQSGTNTSHYEQHTRFSQTGVTVAVSNPLVSLAQTAQQMADASTKTTDPRMLALAAATTGLAAKNTYDTVKAGQGTTIGGKEGQILTGTDSNGKPTSRDATAMDKVGGINVSVSVGSSSSKSDSRQDSQTAVGSTLAAGHDLTIRAHGAGADSNLVVEGSNLSAGNNVTLTADNAIQLIAAANSSSQHGTSSSSGFSAGLGFALGGSQNGITTQFGINRGQGKNDGSDVSYTNTRVNAGNILTLASGGDTTLNGAIASGRQVQADVGGNLNIASLQDRSTYSQKDGSTGFSVSLCLPPFCTGAALSGGSASYSSTKLNSDYQSVSEQSGIKAGDEGFQVTVKGNTDLKGAVIASTQEAAAHSKNSFVTGGSLTLIDLQNTASYKGNSVAVNIGAAISNDGKLVPQGSAAGIGRAEGRASSSTTSGISGIAGNIDVRSGDSANGIRKIFDADKVQKDLNAQVQITQQLGLQASKALDSYLTPKRKALQEQLKNNELSEADKVVIRKELSDLRVQEQALNILIGAVTGMGGAAVTKEALSAAAEKMRTLTIENSGRSLGVVDKEGDKEFTLSNLSGVSEGVRIDMTKTGGVRNDLDLLCGTDNRRCVTEKNSNGEDVLALVNVRYVKEKDSNGEDVLVPRGQVQWKREGAGGLSLEDWLATDEGQKMAGMTGGIQGAKGTLFGISYEAGSWQDKLVEAFGGTHDYIGGQLTGLYDKQGNIKRGMSSGERTAYNAWSIVAIAPATPFAMAELLSPEVWKGISILLGAGR